MSLDGFSWRPISYGLHAIANRLTTLLVMCVYVRARAIMGRLPNRNQLSRILIAELCSPTPIHTCIDCVHEVRTSYAYTQLQYYSMLFSIDYADR